VRPVSSQAAEWSESFEILNQCPSIGVGKIANPIFMSLVPVSVDRVAVTVLRNEKELPGRAVPRLDIADAPGIIFPVSHIELAGSFSRGEKQIV